MTPANLGVSTERPKASREEHRLAAKARQLRVQFLIALSETDVAALDNLERPGDLLNLVAGLYRYGFISAGSGDPAREIQRRATEIRADTALLHRCIETNRKLLAAVADKTRFDWALLPGSKFILDATRNVGSIGHWGHFTPMGSQALEQTVVLQAMHLLSDEEGRLVRRCRRLSCGRIFLATRPKQIFCSRKCASASSFENYKRQIGEEEYKAKHRVSALQSWRSLGASRKRKSKKRKKLNGK
jgi:hypothetical protein